VVGSYTKKRQTRTERKTYEALGPVAAKQKSASPVARRQLVARINALHRLNFFPTTEHAKYAIDFLVQTSAHCHQVKMRIAKAARGSLQSQKLLFCSPHPQSLIASCLRSRPSRDHETSAGVDSLRKFAKCGDSFPRLVSQIRRKTYLQASGQILPSGEKARRPLSKFQIESVLLFRL